MEDLNALADNSLEDDFINLVEKKFPKSMFIRSASVMLGPDWKISGQEILKEHEPRLLKDFLVYTK